MGVESCTVSNSGALPLLSNTASGQIVKEPANSSQGTGYFWRFAKVFWGRTCRFKISWEGLDCFRIGRDSRHSVTRHRDDFFAGRPRPIHAPSSGPLFGECKADEYVSPPCSHYFCLR